jgi:hypothetical protein
MVKERRMFNVTVNPARTNYYDQRVDLVVDSGQEGTPLNLVLNDCRWPVVLEDFRRLQLVHGDHPEILHEILSENQVGRFSVWCTRIDLTAIGFRLASQTPERELVS